MNSESLPIIGYRSMIAAVIIMSSIALSMLALPEAHAQYDSSQYGVAGQYSPPEQVPSGEYVNNQAGFSIVVPEGFSGQVSVNTSTDFSMSVTQDYQGGGMPVTMTLFIGDKSELKNNSDTSTPPPNTSGCVPQTNVNELPEVTISGITFKVYTQSFTGCGFSSESKNYYGETATRYITLSEQSFGGTADFSNLDKFASSLKIENNTSASAPALKTTVERISLKGKDIDLNVDSSSTVSNFSFSEDAKKLSFRVTGQDGTQGITVIPISRLLKSPYTVTMDGNTVTNFETLQDSTTGDTSIKLTYHHSSHDIVISGAEVAPEFSTIAALVLAASLIAIIGLTRIAGKGGRHLLSFGRISAVLMLVILTGSIVMAHTSLPMSANATADWVDHYPNIDKWGEFGNGKLQFDIGNDYDDLNGSMAVDSHGSLYITDNYNFRIEVIDSHGNFVKSWKQASYNTGTLADVPIFPIGDEPQTDHGEFWYRSYVAIGPSDTIYVNDAAHSRVEIFDSNGNFIRAWQNYPGGPRFGDENFWYNVDLEKIAVDSVGNAYLLSEGKNLIIKFDSTGHYLTTWGDTGSENDQLSSPKGIAIDSADNIYVADESPLHIRKFDSNGHFVTAWGSTGSGIGQFAKPSGIAVDSAGNIYVADSRQPRDKSTPGYNFYVSDGDDRRIQAFNSTGQFITSWGFKIFPDGEGGDNLTEYPNLAVDNSGLTDHLYVTNNHDSYVQVIDRAEAPVKANDETVKLDGQDTKLNIISSSTVTDVNFSDTSKQVSFKVLGQDNTRGTTIIPINKLLKAPYTVTMDGKNIPIEDCTQDSKGILVEDGLHKCGTMRLSSAADEIYPLKDSRDGVGINGGNSIIIFDGQNIEPKAYLVKDERTGDSAIGLVYHHSSHDVVISGAEVAPEFSTIAALVLAVSLVAIMGLSRVAGMGGKGTSWFLGRRSV